jgi:crotonobetainyl-CoA:carnitine CoA-transferase CaiB-like acyl-CoA transferase
VEITRSPLLGEHNTEILQELLEFRDDEVERLAEAGAV